jgi:hypothetical protein
MDLALPCPVEGCDEVLRSDQDKSDHLKKKHPDAMIYACTYDDCEKSFKTLRERFAHLKKEHPPLRFPCPDPNCDKDFASEQKSIRHQRAAHLDLGIKCKYDGCDKILTSTSGMRCHVLNYHERQNFLCPYCHRTFFAKRNLNNHVKYVHETNNLHDIECQAEGCNFQSKLRSSVIRYMKIKHPNILLDHIPCPLAGEELCEKKFTSPIAASQHANSAHRGKWPCPYASHIDCKKKFDTKEYAYLHGSRVHDLYLCSVPNYVFAISQRWICYTGMWLHIKNHQGFGHYGESEPTEPKKAVPGAPEWQAIFEQVNDEDQPEDDEDLPEDDEDLPEDDEDLPYDDEELVDDDDNFDKPAPKGERGDSSSQALEDQSDAAFLSVDLFRKHLDVIRKQLKPESIAAVENEVKIRNQQILNSKHPGSIMNHRDF